MAGILLPNKHMAKRSDAVLQGGNVPLERERYTLRIKEASFGESAASNPMITVKAEIVTPAEVQLANGMKAKIGGMEVPYYLVLKDTKLAEAFMFYDKLGNPVDEIDEENPDTTWMIGKHFDAILSSKEEFMQRKNPETGKWENILDAAGKPVSRGYKVQSYINEIIGEVAAPVA